ncbi:MAG: HutD family protein [Planctomycetes bacterium]|nr:HutD family protein [Planctomycetota bacterium]
MAVEFVPAAAQPVTPWKNGGGSTRQVAIEPRDATVAGGFRWRVSIAQVAVDGPFSRFPGIDRSLWLLAGAGMELEVDGRIVRLDRRLQRFDFAGETPISARLLAGPTQDLNVMVARGVPWSAAIVSVRPGESRNLVLTADDQVVLAIDGEVRIGDGLLHPGDALRATTPGRRQVVATASTPAALLVAGFGEAQRPPSGT